MCGIIKEVPIGGGEFVSQKQFTVVVTDAIPRVGLERLFDECRVFYPWKRKQAFEEEELMELLPECDAILAGSTITRRMIFAAKRLKIISNYGAGYDRVDISAADEAGVIVTNIPDSTADSTAELAITLMLDVCRRVTELDRMIRNGPSERVFGMGRYMGHNLSGSTLGIIGMGRIGGKVAQVAKTLGMRVVYHNRNKIFGQEDDWRELDDLMHEADVVSIHCPLNEETRGLINRDVIRKMKKGAVLINTARGGVVDVGALVEALSDGSLSGAGIDVYPNEPHVPEALKTMRNVVLTPHIGTNTYETRKKMAEAAALRILAVRYGKTPPNIVNKNLHRIEK